MGSSYLSAIPTEAVSLDDLYTNRGETMEKDSVCGMEVEPKKAAAQSE